MPGVRKANSYEIIIHNSDAKSHRSGDLTAKQAGFQIGLKEYSASDQCHINNYTVVTN